MNNDKKATDPYKDIIDLPRHISKTRGKMSLRDRSAQFSPFAAVTGHDHAIKETSRLTDKRIELDENAKNFLNEKLRIIQETIDDCQEIEVVYFHEDDKKSGGKYLPVIASVKKIDLYDSSLIMMNGEIIPIEDILEINGPIFQVLEDFNP